MREVFSFMGFRSASTSVLRSGAVDGFLRMDPINDLSWPTAMTVIVVVVWEKVTKLDRRNDQSTSRSRLALSVVDISSPDHAYLGTLMHHGDARLPTTRLLDKGVGDDLDTHKFPDDGGSALYLRLTVGCMTCSYINGQPVARTCLIL